ncbi:DUF6318 family protein [Kocuria palustris]|uniref:DUF6318 family protein n=1 Tax=Kocuria palustris TaxID=71999 RepID=UPI0011AA97BB|nr:DUF6318 family protein [Kocuria palustris]
MSTRTVTLSVLAAGLGLLLAGCNESGGPSPDESPADPASAVATSESPGSESTGGDGESPGGEGEYVPASAEGPAQNVPKPEKPALADEESYEGAQAFLDYLADARAYAWQTGDTTLIREITSDACESCLAEYDEIELVYDEGGWASSGQEEIEIIDTDMPVNSFGFPSPRADVRYEGQTIWNSSGEIDQKYPPTGSDDSLTHMHMSHDGVEWIFVVASADAM